MKGVNLKKLGAIIGGAAILASSVAFAGLMYGNTELVNDNGQIVAKVVVGANAAASDGVAAANIAATLAKNAYVKKTLSAQVTGTPTAEGGNATCEVTDKAVTLEVYVPGLKGTETHQFEPLIGDTLDLELGNRNNVPGDFTATQDDTERLTKLNDLLDEKASPLQDQNGGSLRDYLEPEIGSSDGTYTAYVIDGTKFDAFADYKVKSGKFGIERTEYQKIYLEGYTKYMESEDEVVLRGDSVVYQIVFGPQDEGLPLCPGDVSKKLGECEDANSMGSARYMIKFLGTTWVISGVEYSAGNNMQTAQDSGEEVSVPDTGDFTLKLAKEAKYGIVHIRQALETDDGYKIILKDISRNDELGNPAIIEVKDANNNTVAEDQITPGHTKEIALPGGKKLRIHIYQTAPGYTLASAWAEMAVLGDEIRLEHGKTFLDYDGKDSEWTVNIGLVNKDASGSTYNVGNQTHLKEILLIGDRDAFGEDNYVAEGDSMKVIDLEGYQAFEVLNNGLEEVDTDRLSITVGDYDDTKTVYDDADINGNSNTNEEVEITIHNYVKIKSNDNRAFDDGNNRGGEVWFAWITYAGNNYTASLIKDKDGDWHLVGFDQDDDDGDTHTVGSFDYYWMGDDGKVVLEVEDDVNNGFGIALVENVGDVNGTDAVMGFELIVKNLDSLSDDAEIYDANSVSSEQDDDEITYVNPTTVDLTDYGYPDAGGGDDYDEGFISMRGTVLKSADKNTRVFEVPKSVRHLQLVVKPTEMAAEEMEMTEVGPLREGEEASVGDVKIKVKKIDVTTTATAGGTIECSLEGVSAVITDGTATYENFTAYVPAEVPSDVVVLDTEAPDTGTVIAVGGPVVNSVTADLLAGSDVEITPDNPVVVKEIAQGKIVVAGYTAEDTLEAAKQFIAALQKV